MAISTRQLRILADYRLGVDLPDRLAFAQQVVAQQADALLQAADEIESLQAMVITLTQELEHCKGSNTGT